MGDTAPTLQLRRSIEVSPFMSTRALAANPCPEIAAAIPSLGL